MSAPPFHLAFEVTDLAQTERFYVEVLGCCVGRRAARWIDFDFRGHQISAHLVAAMASAGENPVDGDAIPARHFGLVLPWEEWHETAARLGRAGTDFLLPPKTRFMGQPGEQATLFLRDPSGNAIELKSFRDPDMMFAG
ncbi:MAG: VOC family protein [Sandaracinaceae bacterium]